MKRLIILLTILLSLTNTAYAVRPDEVLPDPVLEQRARDISAGLRCMVCQNQSIDASDAELARSLRLLVRERLVAGDSNDQVEQFLVDRYGEFVLLNPRLSIHTILLWIAAPALLIFGLISLLFARKKHSGTSVSELTAEEQAALDELRSGK
jgi:cytochrome c-type biogenesis protein CcmH